MDDLSDRLKELEGNPLPDLWDEIGSRAGREAEVSTRHRWIAGAVAAIIGIGAIATALIAFGPIGRSSPAVSEAPPADGYTFEFLGFGTAPNEHQVAARMALSWAATTFPGIRDCTMDALDSQGGVVGRYTHELANLHPDRPETFIQEISVDGPAVTVTGKCGPRLDTGDPYAYDLGRPRLTIEHDGGATIELQPTWLGAKPAGFMSCRVVLLDQDATVVGRTDVIEPEHIGEPFWMIRLSPSDIDVDLHSYPLGVSPKLDCVPYVDGHEAFPALPSSPLPDPVAFDFVSPPGSGYAFSNVVFEPTFDGWTTNYTIGWENGVFPGERRCTVSVLGPNGETLNTWWTDYESMDPSTRGSIDSDARPQGFTASCGPRLDTPVPYVIADVQAQEGAGAVTIEFTVKFPADITGDAFVGSNQCIAALVEPGTVVAAKPFTLSAPDGTRTRTTIDHASLDPSTDPVIRCEPYEGQDAMASMLSDFETEIEGN